MTPAALFYATLLVSYYGGKALCLGDNGMPSPVDISLVVYKERQPESLISQACLRMNQNATPHTQVHSAPASGDQKASSTIRYGQCAAQPPNLAAAITYSVLGSASPPWAGALPLPQVFRIAAVIELGLRMPFSPHCCDVSELWWIFVT